MIHRWFMMGALGGIFLIGAPDSVGGHFYFRTLMHSVYIRFVGLPWRRQEIEVIRANESKSNILSQGKNSHALITYNKQNKSTTSSIKRVPHSTCSLGPRNLLHTRLSSHTPSSYLHASHHKDTSRLPQS